MADMKTSPQGVALIKYFEGFRMKPYLCSAKVPTIGYGSTFYETGRKVQRIDPPITEKRAEELLMNTLKVFETGVLKLIQPGTYLTQHQFDALVSFAFNLGLGNLKKSTLMKKVNENPNDPTIEQEFLKWVKAGGKVLNGLVKRRHAEWSLYNTKV